MGKYGNIRETDMWNKRPEFTTWLLELKEVNLESLPHRKEKKMFKDFMEDHNTGTFSSKKYYEIDGYYKRKLEKEIKKGLKWSMEGRMAQALKEKARRKEEIVYLYKIGDMEGAAAIQRRLDPDVPM